MTDIFQAADQASAAPSNLPEYSVSELSGSVKRTIESTYDRVRVRGELGRVTIAKSGHMYADLKDDRAVLNSVMWKTNVGRLAFKPEEGLEVVAEGKLSTFAGRSAYQLIADAMRPAGVGALMALLEERKKKLAAEGLFDTALKQPLPYLPQVIGVVTSPTGAVIRDILHRLRERFPVHVLLWPALVQGDRAAEQVATGIEGLNAIDGRGGIPRPDLIIVARGGGSIEDLWPFNEERVVRAAVASGIPLISAVGHETDTTLIDYVSDRRAPTPTGAAEMAVPVRIDLINDVSGLGQRLLRGLTQVSETGRKDLRAVSARLPRPETFLITRQQRFDLVEGKLASALSQQVLIKRGQFERVAPRLQPLALSRVASRHEADLTALDRGLKRGLKGAIDLRRERVEGLAKQLSQRAASIEQKATDRSALDALWSRAGRAMAKVTDSRAQSLASKSALLEALSHKATLARGFALVQTPDGKLVRTSGSAASEVSLELTFADGSLSVSPTKPAPAAQNSEKRRTPKPKQASLFDE